MNSCFPSLAPKLLSLVAFVFAQCTAPTPKVHGSTTPSESATHDGSATQAQAPAEAVTEAGPQSEAPAVRTVAPEKRAPAAARQDDPGPARASDARTPDDAARGTVAPPFVIDRGPDRQEVWIPRDEELVFNVMVDLGVLGNARVGDVTITSKVEPFHSGGLLALDGAGTNSGTNGDKPELEQAIVSAHASGNYAVYTADQLISTRILPQAWPHFLLRNVQTGSENRQRELLIGTRDGVSTSTHRSDGHCRSCDDRAHFLKPNWVWQDEYHCTSCKRAEHRVWKPFVSKDVPEGTLDMVTAVMLARTMVQQGKPSAKFQLLDREKLWDVELSRGKHERRTVHAGAFDTIEVKLKTSRAVTEKRKDGDFEGLFGLHGSISIWMHPESGVPVAVTGSVPAGPLTVDVSIELSDFRGTPDTFRKVVGK